MAGLVIEEGIKLGTVAPVLGFLALGGVGLWVLSQKKQGGGGGGAWDWSITGASGERLSKNGSITVDVNHIDMPHDSVEVWAVGSSNPAQVPGDADGWTKWAGAMEPYQIGIDLAHFPDRAYAAFPYMFVVLVVKKGASEVATGNPNHAGHDQRLIKRLTIV